MSARHDGVPAPLKDGPHALFQPVCVWDLRAELGEGPIWIEADKSLYFVDILGRAVHRYDPATGRSASWAAPARPCFLTPTTDGSLLCGLEDGLYRFDPATGRFSLALSVERDQPGNRINDGHVDPYGRLWFGTMDDAETTASGSLYSIGGSLDAGLRHHHGGYTVSNGPAASPDGRTLYHCDSALGTIYAFDLSPEGGLSGRRVFRHFADGAPDGLAMDSAGVLWVGIWGGGRIERLTPEGGRLEPIVIPARNVTKVAFGGPDFRTVFVTTARKGLADDLLHAEPQTGGLFAFRVDVAGAPPRGMSPPDASTL
ncbi:transcriptional regulator [Acetobacter nitrogenifigens DSM 23921 = NBRC 105050]|uniref:Gluconolaconase n=1 Tax=Acetobacter nitrogenifigens DSM 23921 = NBRC 105050 TaxID=1120919 RepID=A0A511XCP3_9PROT|nr:SMP-30/gluconolactonase/LRE family protein [Acetobacter nitrogenifigens]GBQ87858.1 transcriptional regulator [Acetobacter nitrogenifigens DSM 23921 = NBRC 105050]GEN60710.1 gluconolaconase [Acetobacter nitrogenifigens DSM 23921 = NBRC 105050]